MLDKKTQEKVIELYLKIKKLVMEFEEFYTELYVKELMNYIEREKIPVAFIVYRVDGTLIIVSQAGGDEFEFGWKYKGDPFLLRAKLLQKGIELLRCDQQYDPQYCEDED